MAALEYHWDILRDNELLRKLLSSKVEELKLSHNELANRTGLARTKISQYLRGSRTNRLSQWAVVKLANELGYEIKLDIGIRMPSASFYGGNP